MESLSLSSSSSQHQQQPQENSEQTKPQLEQQHVSSSAAATPDLSQLASLLSHLLRMSRRVACRRLSLSDPSARRLMDSVDTLEHNVKELEDLLQEEERALDELQTMEKRARRRQRGLLDLLSQVEVTQPHQQHLATGHHHHYQNHHYHHHPTKSSSSVLGCIHNQIKTPDQGDSLSQQQVSSSLASKYSSRPPASTPPRRSNYNTNNSGSRHPQTTPHRHDHNVSFAKVTKAEFETSIPRTMRSGISIAMINDALVDLEHLMEKAGDNWVTEQEIRQHCSFFRHGEATARATLLLLCSLHRLRQRPEKGGEFIYAVPLPPTPR